MVSETVKVPLREIPPRGIAVLVHGVTARCDHSARPWCSQCDVSHTLSCIAFAASFVAAVERARPVLERLGTTLTHFGPVGSGQAVKAVNQVMISGVYLAVAEGIVLAMKAGLDPDQVVAALGGGVAGSWILANRSGKMIANDYPLGFRTSLHLKDLGIALAMAKELGVPFLGAVPIYQPIRQGADEGVPLMTSEPESPAGLAIMAAADATDSPVHSRLVLGVVASSAPRKP